MPVIELTKKCPHCLQVKSVNDFCKNRTNKDGLQSECKTCSATYQRARQEKKKLLQKTMINTPQVLDVSRIDELLKGVDQNMALLQLAQTKNQELNKKLVEYASRIIELQNQIASENRGSH